MELAAEIADTRMTTLIKSGSTVIPAALMAITNGEELASPVPPRRSGDVEGTNNPTVRVLPK